MNNFLDYIDNLKDLVIELQKGLTRIKAINPENGGDGEYEKFLWLKNFISNWGFSKIDEIIVPDQRVTSKIRPTLIVSIKGKIDRNLWFITHLDVVPEGEIKLWNTSPFEAIVKDDKIYGRGTEDNQQSLVSSLIAAKTILDNKIIPKYNVNLMFVADEEVGSTYGIDWILKNTKIFNQNDLIVTPDVGDPEGSTIEIAEKSILWIQFRIIGKQSHGSRPDKGINAARASSHLCIRVDKLRDYYNEQNPLFDIPYSTFEPTKRIGSVINMNTIPGEEILGFDCRILPCYDLQKVLDDIKEIAKGVEYEFGVKIEITTPQFVQASPPTSEDSEVVQLLKSAIKKVTGKTPKPVGIGGGTVAAYFRKIGIPAALWSTVDNTMHSPNEYSSIKNTLKDAKVFFTMMVSNEE